MASIVFTWIAGKKADSMNKISGRSEEFFEESCRMALPRLKSCFESILNRQDNEFTNEFWFIMPEFC